MDAKTHSKNKKKYVYIIITDKGGTGKTLFSRTLAYKLIADGRNPLLVDGDGEIGGLYQFHKDSLTVRFTGTEKDRDELMSILDSNRDTILVDMPAASITSLAIFDEDVKFFEEIKKEGYTLVLINVFTPFKASIRTIKQMVELAGDNAKYVAVQNTNYGDDDDFFLWFGDDNAGLQPAKSKIALEQAGGLEIKFHKLQTGVLVAMDLTNTNFADAMGDKSPLKRVHKSRLHTWLKLMDGELSKIEGV